MYTHIHIPPPPLFHHHYSTTIIPPPLFHHHPTLFHTVIIMLKDFHLCLYGLFVVAWRETARRESSLVSGNDVVHAISQLYPEWADVVVPTIMVPSAADKAFLRKLLHSMFGQGAGLTRSAYFMVAGLTTAWQNRHIGNCIELQTTAEG
jgi:hypothetical protein